MTEERRERADAARNRRAILLATEELLTRHRPEQISMEQVAVAAGVGKGTVFHRFGSRIGLFEALMVERAHTLHDAMASGEPPLGPGAPPQERILAFLDAVVEMIAWNKGLLAALGHAVASAHKPSDEPHPIYQLWYGHISTLITEARPDLDAEVLTHVLLAPLNNDPLLRILSEGGAARLQDALHAIVATTLNSGGRTIT
jgi:AcrR family transcriptional regulator